MGNKKNNVKRVTKKRLTRNLVNRRKHNDNERLVKYFKILQCYSYNL